MRENTYLCSPRYRIYPNKQQREQIDTTLDAVRFIHNYFLAATLDTFLKSGKYPPYRELQAQLPAVKEYFPWLKTAPSSAMQIALQHLIRAFQDHDRRKVNGLNPGTPRFQSKYDYQQSYRNSNPHNVVAVIGNRVKLPKLIGIKICCAPVISGRIIAATVTREGRDRYYISFCYIPEHRPPLPATGRAVGVDLGLKTYAVTSDGDELARYYSDKRQREKLDRLRERLQRQTKGSNRWRKTRDRIMRLSRKLYNRRQDSIHKITSKLVHKYDIICIESLYHPSMMAQNEYRHYAIQYSGWNEFKRQINYKCDRYGRQLVPVSRFFPSSQLCSVCGSRYPQVKNPKVRTWTCPTCGTVHDRDLNAATNIKHEGLRLLDQVAAA